MLNSAISLYYYVRIVVFMYLKKETTGSEPTTSPALALALGVAVAATLVLGVYPRLLFEVAEASARTLGATALPPPFGKPFSQDMQACRCMRPAVRLKVCASRSAAGELFHKVRYTPVRAVRRRMPCLLIAAFRAGSATPVSGSNSPAPLPAWPSSATGSTGRFGTAPGAFSAASSSASLAASTTW